MKKVSIPLSVAGIDKLKTEIEEYQAKLVNQSKVFVQRLAETGVEIASVKFSRAAYAGENDVKVSVEPRERGGRAVVATGNAALFIEFGTGVTFPDDHPEKPSGVSGRGTYGKGRGSRSRWGYYGEPGNLGRVEKTTPKGKLVTTAGNPANECMYLTVKELESRIREIAGEVFV